MGSTVNDQSPEPIETASPTDTDEAGTERVEGESRQLSRRGTLNGLAGLAGLGLLAGEASAQQDDPKSREWKTDIDADGHRLLNLGGVTTRTNQTELTDFAGNNLSIDDSGRLNADEWDTDIAANGHSLTGVGTLEADSVSITNPGARFFASLHEQTVEPYPGESSVSVLFNQTDDFSEYFELFSPGEIICTQDGFYQVYAQIGDIEFEDNPGSNSWIQLDVESGSDQASGFGFGHSFGSCTQPILDRFSGRHVTLSTFGIGPISELQQVRVEFRNATDVPVTFGQLGSSFLTDVYVDIVKVG